MVPDRLDLMRGLRAASRRGRRALARALRGLAAAVETHPPATGGTIPPYEPRPDTVRAVLSPGGRCTCSWDAGPMNARPVRYANGCPVHDLTCRPHLTGEARP